MSSWLTQLAGQAVSALEQADQLAASNLKKKQQEAARNGEALSGADGDSDDSDDSDASYASEGEIAGESEHNHSDALSKELPTASAEEEDKTRGTQKDSSLTETGDRHPQDTGASDRRTEADKAPTPSQPSPRKLDADSTITGAAKSPEVKMEERHTDSSTAVVKTSHSHKPHVATKRKSSAAPASQKRSSEGRSKQQLRRVIGELEHEIAEYAVQLKDFQQQLSTAKNTLASCERQLSDARSDNKKLLASIRDLKASEASLTKERLGLQTRLTAVEEENERLVREHAQAITEHAERLSGLQAQLASSQQSNETTQREIDSKIDSTEAMLVSERKRAEALEAQLTDRDQRIASLQAGLSESSRRFTLLQEAHDSVQQDLTSYKKKATKILAAKEALITTLRSRNGEDSDRDAKARTLSGSGTGSTSSLLSGGDGEQETSVELSALLGSGEFPADERSLQALTQQLTAAHAEIATLQARLVDAEEARTVEGKALNAAIATLRGTISDLERKEATAESDFKRHIRELTQARKQLVLDQQDLSQKYQAVLREKKQLEEKMTSNFSQMRSGGQGSFGNEGMRPGKEGDFGAPSATLYNSTNSSSSSQDDRLRTKELLQNLLDKQGEVAKEKQRATQLEIELQTLRERLQTEMQLRAEAERVAERKRRRNHHGFDDSMALRPIIPPGVATGTTEFNRRMKTAANALDAFSIRLGQILRLYPMARVFLIFYIVLLHLWVMFVLLTTHHEVTSDLHLNALPDPNKH